MGRRKDHPDRRHPPVHDHGLGAGGGRQLRKGLILTDPSTSFSSVTFLRTQSRLWTQNFTPIARPSSPQNLGLAPGDASATIPAAHNGPARSSNPPKQPSQPLAYETGRDASGIQPPTEQQLENETPSIPKLDYSPARLSTMHTPPSARYRLYAGSYVLAVIGGQVQSVAIVGDLSRPTRP
jgi:hypothetical protein